MNRKKLPYPKNTSFSTLTAMYKPKYTPKNTKYSSTQSSSTQAPLETFDYFLILDFEATCDNNRQFNPQEIIEFPTVVLNAKTLEIETEFHSYCKPVHQPQLTKFCQELTGIQQEWVDAAPTFPEVYDKYDSWLKELKLVNNEGKRINFAFVTCGDWDLKSMIKEQTRLSGLPIHNYFKQWINIKNLYGTFYNRNPGGMPKMLSYLGLNILF
eukprot:TRINITY_DN6154_c0_g1_i3.p1 TRINITY_DN6154_c0_g1~~TRINITY_DN6154_c0_g1_i3.p1  ORF type:complete len:212 (+),score=31.12 TRINITY_DN6154_c0_g1_i3:116-751(+)